MLANYKVKYIDMRAKLLEATDVAYRLGYEEGLKEGEQVAQQKEAEEAALQQQAAMGDMPPEEGSMPSEEGSMPPEEGSMPPEGIDEEAASELDDHIDQLHSLVAKGEKPKVTDLRKTIKSLTNLRKSQKDKWRKKTEKTTSSQKNLVDGILAKWEKESKNVTENLENIIKEDGIKLEG